MSHKLTQTQLSQNRLLFDLCHGIIPSFEKDKTDEFLKNWEHGSPSEMAMDHTDHFFEYLNEVWDTYIAMEEGLHAHVYGTEADETFENASMQEMITNFHQFLGGWIEGMNEQED